MKFVEWANGIVMCFDEKGKQVPKYQGPIEEIGLKCQADYPEQWAKREYGDWNKPKHRYIKVGEE